eukprot:CAMPEP_0174821850 /NCGR_PEP_ID=MMETSP1107-20130205/10468_1 /TAXON_ID=36770 /ORGANISM="Paraphysomonas vestita, Strain GFlagA" /LENGTH=232 /DNA_ID=CAMNT_0016039345 /DNA_START=478 /DNA_END=1173 /DNA_ORIENTATION=-
MTEDVVGCNANFRYHADRADFSVTDSARAKIVVNNNKLSVFIDPNNSGSWNDCATADLKKLSPDWLSKSHIGITASTGQLADNHDVISLQSFSDQEVLEQHEEAKKKEKAFALNENDTLDTRLSKMEAALNDLLGKAEFLDHHVEHALASIDDHIANMIGKIEKREDKSESRIGDLESIIKKEIDGTLERRLDRLENQLNGNVNRKVKGMETELNKQIEAQLEVTKSTAGSW